MLQKSAFLGFLLLPLSASQALADPSLIQTGRLIAEVNCQRCHAITQIGESPFVEAPPFRVIARIYNASDLEEALVEGIVVGHPAMPEFRMTAEQAAAITAYIDNLNGPN
jgi:cytochrome c